MSLDDWAAKNIEDAARREFFGKYEDPQAADAIQSKDDPHICSYPDTKIISNAEELQAIFGAFVRDYPLLGEESEAPGIGDS